MSEEDPAKLAKETDKQADEMDRQADEMQERSEQLGSEVDELRQDWERKRQDEAVPGAPPPEGEPDDGQVGPPADPEGSGREH